MQVAFKPERRGLHDVPPLTAETRFPLGTLPRLDGVAAGGAGAGVPAPEPHPPPLPPASRAPAAPAQSRSADGGEFEGVRAYRRGDPLKLVVWKKAAQARDRRTGQPRHQQAQRHELWLDWRACGALPAEARLSRLTAWVLQADRAGATTACGCPASRSRPPTARPHARRCLEALALWSRAA